jgi:hypothetical protein
LKTSENLKEMAALIPDFGKRRIRKIKMNLEGIFGVLT